MIEYKSRSKNEITLREVSPQRMIHYRDNWYLDAWCHHKDALRSFSLDAINAVELSDKLAFDVNEYELNSILSSGYGIFAGKDVEWATLLFSPNRARWVANEKWHPAQIGKMLDDGSYELQVPYSDTREILMDIMKYGADVRVIDPIKLKALVKASLEEALRSIV